MSRNHPLADDGSPLPKDAACRGSLALGSYCGQCPKCRKAVAWLIAGRDALKTETERLADEIEHLRDLLAREVDR